MCAVSTNPIGFPCVIGSGHCLSGGCVLSGGSDTNSLLCCFEMVKKISCISVLFLKDIWQCS